MTNDNTTQATLNAWQTQLEQVRQRRLARGGGHAGLAHLHQVQGKTGLQVMTALLDGDLPHPYMADTFDCELVELGDGHAVFQATPQLKHYNPLGSVHGGWYATLLDFALGCAVQTRLPAGRSYTTSQINLNIVRAANTKTGPLRCVGTALHVGRQVGTSEARIVDADRKLTSKAGWSKFGRRAQRATQPGHQAHHQQAENRPQPRASLNHHVDSFHRAAKRSQSLRRMRETWLGAQVTLVALSIDAVDS